MVDMTEGAVDALSVSMLHDKIRRSLREVAPDNTWVWGEVKGKKLAPSGHVYLDLVERRAGGVSASIKVMANARHLDHIRRECLKAGVTIDDGVEIRIRGGLDTYAPNGTMTFQMNHIDATWTLGRLAHNKDQLLKDLAREGLLTTNKRLYLSPLPLKIALVTSVDSAAYHDLTDELLKQDVAYDIRAYDARVQGDDAKRSIGTALWKITQLQKTSWQPDCVVVIRGGGSKTDLAVFDDEALVRYLAQMPYPVLTGIGHEVDHSVSDEVAHHAYKTPTAVASGINDRVRQSREELKEQVRRIQGISERTILHHDRELEHTKNTIARAATNTLDNHTRWLQDVQERTQGSALRYITSAEAGLEVLLEHTTDVSRSSLTKHEAELQAWERLLTAHDPKGMLERGWSITRDDEGNLVTSTPLVGTTLKTTVKGGVITSTTKEYT